MLRASATPGPTRAEHLAYVLPTVRSSKGAVVRWTPRPMGVSVDVPRALLVVGCDRDPGGGDHVATASWHAI